jgi:hypothetical protein
MALSGARRDACSARPQPRSSVAHAHVQPPCDARTFPPTSHPHQGCRRHPHSACRLTMPPANGSSQCRGSHRANPSPNPCADPEGAAKTRRPVWTVGDLVDPNCRTGALCCQLEHPGPPGHRGLTRRLVYRYSSRGDLAQGHDARRDPLSWMGVSSYLVSPAANRCRAHAQRA